MKAAERTVPGLSAALGLWAMGVQTHESLATLGAWGCAAMMVAEALQKDDTPIRPAQRLKPWWPLVAFLAWALLAPTLAGEPPTATGVARLSDWLLLPVAAAAFGRATPAQRRTVAWVAGATMALSCVAAGFQHYGFWPPLESFDGLGWTRVRFSRVYEVVPNTEQRFMAGGLLFHRLKFANLTSIGTVLALAFGLRAGGKTRVLALALAALGLISVAIFPYARSALVALAVGVVATVLLSVRQKALAVGLAGALLTSLVLAVLLLPDLRERFASATSASGSGERAALLGTGLAAVRAHPIAGVGAGRFHPALFAAPDAPAQVVEHEGKSHNQFVSLAAEGGAITGLLFVALLLWLGQAFWRGRPDSLGPLAALAVFVLLSLSHDPLFHAEFSLGLVGVLGLGLALAERPPSVHSEPSRGTDPVQPAP